MTVQFDLITPETSMPIDVKINDCRIWLSAETLYQITGWLVKPEGFCLDEVCVPAGAAIDLNGRVDLAAFADLTGRPLVVDLDENAMSLGVEAFIRGSELSTLQAADFTLPDLSGNQHSLSQYRGKKILLAAYASW